MTLNKFKLTTNKSRPSQCYNYTFKEDDMKYEIFTMDSGKTFLASIEQLDPLGAFRKQFSATFRSVGECLQVFKNLH